MSRIRKLALASALGLLAGGCAIAPSHTVNYGHPALAVPAQQLSYDPGNVALGAILGGAVGSRFGQGSGRLVGVGVGAATGAMMGQGGYSPEAALGALAGGAIGSRFGGGSGRALATAIGAGYGAFLAAPPVAVPKSRSGHAPARQYYPAPGPAHYYFAPAPAYYDPPSPGFLIVP